MFLVIYLYESSYFFGTKIFLDKPEALSFVLGFSGYCFLLGTFFF